MNEIDSKTMAAIKSIPSTTRLWLGGYRVDIPQDDWMMYDHLTKAKEIVTDSRSKQENYPKEVDKVEEVGENESSLSEKGKVFRDALVVLLGHIEVKTPKIDELLTKLKEM